MTPRVARPWVLRAVDAPKAWGWEKWLTSTRSEGAASLAGAEASEPRTLAGLVAAHPEVLGAWARRVFGDEMPIFAKLIHTDFPTRVHLGFRRAVPREELLGWLDAEQARVRRLLGALRVGDASAFDAYQTRYAAWATAQALVGWRRDDDATTATALGPFVDASFDLRAWAREARDARAAIVDVLNEIDLAHEADNLLLSSAGVVHAIFGLSHQTHPLDRSRAALESLFATLAERDAARATDAELARIIDAADLPALRAANRAPPKNEAWLPTSVDGAAVLVEPQQTSDTTYSLADFYTPLTWSGDRPRFRKGAATSGLSREELDAYLADVDLAVTSIDSLRRTPKAVAGASHTGAEIACLVDEPTAWPFFTAYRLDLTGTFAGTPPAGVSQQLVVTRGRVELGDRAGSVGELTTSAPGFIPATIDGGYTLTAREPSTVMLFAVPSPRARLGTAG